MPFILFLFVFCICQIADAKSSCGSTTEDPKTWVDMRKPGQSMHNVPVLDQDGIPYCYAYAGTTMASAWLNKYARSDLTPEQRQELVLSPFVNATALSTSRSSNKCNHPCNHVDFVFSNGACSANKTLFVGDKGVRSVDIPGVVLEPCVRWETLGSSKKMMTEVQSVLTEIARSQLSEEAKLRAATDFFEKFFAMSSVQKLSSEEMTNRARIALKSLYDKYRLINPIVAPLCYTRSETSLKYTGNLDLKNIIPKGINPPQCKALTSWSYDCDSPPPVGPKNLKTKDYLKEINQAMDKDKPLPVGVDYCWTFLLDGPDTPTERKNGCRRKDEKSEQVDHKSVLIGRRINSKTKKCEYLLRNSWGNDCNSYFGGTDDFYGSCDQELETNGTADVWIDAELLGDNIHGTETLE